MLTFENTARTTTSRDLRKRMTNHLVTRHQHNRRIRQFTLTFESLEQLNSALQDYQTAAELSPNNPFSYFALGDIYAKLSAHDKAIESYETSIRLGNDGFDVKMQLAHLLQKAGRFSEAIVKFQEARAQYLTMGFQRFVDICDKAIADCRAKKRP